MLVANSSLAVVGSGRSIWVWVFVILGVFAILYGIYALFFEEVKTNETEKP